MCSVGKPEHSTMHCRHSRWTFWVLHFPFKVFTPSVPCYFQLHQGILQMLTVQKLFFFSVCSKRGSCGILFVAAVYHFLKGCVCSQICVTKSGRLNIRSSDIPKQYKIHCTVLSVVYYWFPLFKFIGNKII